MVVKDVRRRLGIGIALTLLTAIGCGDVSSGSGADGGSVDATAGGDACVPAVCGPADCGPTDDGCGGTLDCAGGCDCTAATFADDCPARPCETAIGCTAGVCDYEPVICEFAQCTCPDGATCDEDTPRPCGAGCAEIVCDPQPSSAGGDVVYANACVARTDVRCGLCDLGGYACEGVSASLECVTPDLSWIDSGTAECNGGSPVATVVFVDALVSPDSPDGSRDKPFQDLDVAIAAAIVRGSSAVVIGRSPEIQGTQSVPSGVSILGGYSGWPEWRRDASYRPIFRAQPADVSGGRLVGLVAHDITDPTLVSGIGVVTDDLPGTGSENNAGIWVKNAPALRLVDVEVNAGAGAAGANGTAGTTPVAGGAAAQLGGFGTWDTYDSCTVLGGVGGQRTCDGVATAGAAGGAGGGGSAVFPAPAGTTDECSSDTNRSCYHYRGADGAGGILRGLGGLTDWINPSISSYVDGVGTNATAHASAAAAGANGSAALDFSGDFPALAASSHGGAGTAGLPGGGGGGGSSGEHSKRNVAPLESRCGGGGGGGGAGGCGGRGGTAGRGGGWSLGVVVASSEGLVLDGVQVTVDNGGLGGSGGAGAPGTAGAAGADGRPGGSSSYASLPFRGSRGGDGASGQTGGAGGTGAAGGSAGVVCNGTVDVTGVDVSGPGAGFTNAMGCD